MLCDNGTANGHRILSRKTVDLMMANQLYELPVKYNTFRPNNQADGFGLGGEVRIEAGGDRLGSVRAYGWYSVATGISRVDRKKSWWPFVLRNTLPVRLTVGLAFCEGVREPL